MIVGNKVPAKVGFGPCWINGRKDKNKQGTFLIIIYLQWVRKGMWYDQEIYLGVLCRDRGERGVVQQ